MGMIVKGARAAGAGILLLHLQGAGAKFSLMLSVHLAFHWSHRPLPEPAFSLCYAYHLKQ